MTGESSASRWYRLVVLHARLALALGVVGMLFGVAGLSRLTKDSTLDVFLDPDHPAVQRDLAMRERYGIGDALAVAIIADTGVYHPTPLALLASLTAQVAAAPNVDPASVVSLATANDVHWNGRQVESRPLLGAGEPTEQQADAIACRVQSLPPVQGVLAATDGTGALILARPRFDGNAASAYAEIAQLVARAPASASILVAGESAAGARLGQLIDRDTLALQPIAFAVIVALLIAAFRTAVGTLLPLLVIGAAAAIALGSMALLCIPYYVITSALPVILIGIAVADSLHILAEFYDQRSRAAPGSSPQDIVVRTMCSMWRPVVLTSVTTVAGFLGIAFTAAMPPVFWFAVFAAVGVAVALCYSLVVLPAGLVLMNPAPSPAYASRAPGLELAGRLAAQSRRTAVPLIILLAGIGAGVFGLNRLETDYDPVSQLREDDPIRVAHTDLQRRFAGAHFLEIEVDTHAILGLFDPTRLREVERLQQFVDTLPGVRRTISLVDYLKVLNRAAHAEDPAHYRLPDDRRELGGLLAAFLKAEEGRRGPRLVDDAVRHAHLRVFTESGRFGANRPVVERTQDYIDRNLSDPARVTATLGGRVALDHHWLEPLRESHAASVAFSLLLVYGAASWMFRSAVAGALALFPVALAVLATYGAMGLLGISLDAATSTFAAIAIGLGVDFSIHMVERLRVLTANGQTLDVALDTIQRTTARALLFNFLCVALAFGLLLTSSLPMLRSFGVLVAVAVSAAFVAALVLVPWLYRLVPPRFTAPAVSDR